MQVLNQTVTDKYSIYNADCVDGLKSMPENSIDFTIYSPPFESLYVFSNSDRDMGNNASAEQFWQHYKYMIAENYRITKPGRLVAIHCMNLPTLKERDGFIGIKDFRGEIIRAHQQAGFVYHSEVCIWKCPVAAVVRTKALGLLHKQLKKDSAMSRQGIADYLVVMRKPGINLEPITHTNESFPVSVWQQYASPVWMDIDQSDTLQYKSARDHEDERHISPLQLEVIRRAMDLWSNENDVVLSPFTGIGSEGYVAMQKNRRFIGTELKTSYYNQAVKNLDAAIKEQFSLFE